MPVEYTTRSGQEFRLMVGKSRTGKPNYFMASVKKADKTKGEPAEAIPEGFEINEDPGTGRVSIRRKVPTSITEPERELVEEMIRRLTSLKHFVVKAERNQIIVYTSDIETERELERARLEEMFGPRAFDYFARVNPLTKVLSFTLRDQEQRLFTSSRWYFIDSVDDWIPQSGECELSDLAEHLVPHLGRESFFDPY